MTYTALLGEKLFAELGKTDFRAAHNVLKNPASQIRERFVKDKGYKRSKSQPIEFKLTPDEMDARLE